MCDSIADTIAKQVKLRRLGLFQLSSPHLVAFSFRKKTDKAHASNRQNSSHAVPVHNSVIRNF